MDGDHDDDGGAIVRSVASWEVKEKRGVLHPGKKIGYPFLLGGSVQCSAPKENRGGESVVPIIALLSSSGPSDPSLLRKRKKGGWGKVGMGCGVKVIHLFPEEAAVQVVADGCGVALRVRGRGKPPGCHGGYPLVKGGW